MQLFLPSILVVLVAFIIIFAVMPNLSPLIIVIISAILLVVGTYDHFSTFWNEYQQSTWQNNLKIFAPGILIMVILIYIFIAISSFFTGGSVPVPSLPAMELPSAESATNPVTAAINSTMNSVSDAVNSVSNAAANVGNSIGLGNAPKNNAAKNNAPKNNGVTRSVLATV